MIDVAQQPTLPAPHRRRPIGSRSTLEPTTLLPEAFSRARSSTAGTGCSNASEREARRPCSAPTISAGAARSRSRCSIPGSPTPRARGALVTGGTATAASDLYSVGVMLYELLTGRRPFEADLAVTVALKHANARPAPPARLNPGITPELQAVVMRTLEKPPSRRFPDASAFSAALKQAAPAAATPDVRPMPRAA